MLTKTVVNAYLRTNQDEVVRSLCRAWLMKQEDREDAMEADLRAWVDGLRTDMEEAFYRRLEAKMGPASVDSLASRLVTMCERDFVPWQSALEEFGCAFYAACVVRFGSKLAASEALKINRTTLHRYTVQYAERREIPWKELLARWKKKRSSDPKRSASALKRSAGLVVARSARTSSARSSSDGSKSASKSPSKNSPAVS